MHSKEEWKEGQDRTVKLPEFEAEYFSLYAIFLLVGFLFADCQQDNIVPSMHSSEWIPRVTEVTGDFYQLHKLANFLQCPDLQDVILDSLIESLSELHGEID